MTYYLKSGTEISVAQDEDLAVSNSLPVGTYIVQTRPSGDFFLKATESFARPSKYYGDVIQRAERVISTYKSRSKSTGLLLSGVPGSGKTLLARETSLKCAEQGIPTIIINEPYTGDKFSAFLASIDMECIVMFDEFEKVYDEEAQQHVLTIFDGTYTQKKLFIVTVNETHKLIEPFMSRPGRLYYHYKYNGVDQAFIESYIKENLINQEHASDLIRTLRTLFVGASFDSMASLVEEMNRYGEPIQTVMQVMNVKPTSKMEAKFRITSDKYKEIVHISDNVDDLYKETEIGLHLKGSNAYDSANDDKREWCYFDVQECLTSVDKETGTAYFEHDSHTFGKLKIEAWQEISKAYNIMDAF